MPAWPLEYASPPTTTPISPERRRGVVLACLVLSILAATTCLRIEWLNRQAGGKLPKRYDGKWRAMVASEQKWRDIEARDTGDVTLTTRPLTPTEQATMRQWVDRHQANADLRDVVGTWGVANYLIVLFGLYHAVTIVADGRFGRWHRTFAIVCAVVLIAAGATAVHRGYFTSITD